MKNHSKVLSELVEIVRLLDKQSAGRGDRDDYPKVEASLAAIEPNIEDKERDDFLAAKTNLARVFNSELTGDFGRDCFVLSRFHLTALHRGIRPYPGNPDDFEAGITM